MDFFDIQNPEITFEIVALTQLYHLIYEVILINKDLSSFL